MTEPTVVTSPGAPADGAGDAPAPTPTDSEAPTPTETGAGTSTNAGARTSTNAGAPTSTVPVVRGASRRGPTRWRLWVVGVVLVGALVFLLVEGLGNSLNYFETVDQALAHRATLGSQTFRLEGVVVPGTVRRIPGGVAFVASGSGRNRVDVVNHGNPPQLFQPDIPVVVVGHFSGNSFISDQLIVDHTAQYVEEHPNRVRAPNGTTR